MPFGSMLHTFFLNNVFAFYSYIDQMGFSHGKFGVSFPGESQLRQSRATQPTLHVGCFSTSIIHQTLTWTTGSLTCTQLLMQAITQGGVQTHVRESALKVDSGRKKNPLPHQGIEPASAECRSDALPTELHQ